MRGRSVALMLGLFFLSCMASDARAHRLNTEYRVLPDKKPIETAMLASIGPATSEAIRRHGRAPDVEADSATVPALVAAILRACRDKTH